VESYPWSQALKHRSLDSNREREPGTEQWKGLEPSRGSELGNEQWKGLEPSRGSEPGT